MNKEQTDLFLEDILEFGKQYVATGAQVKRVEDSMINLCKIYGFEDAEIYAITTLIIATISPIITPITTAPRAISKVFLSPSKIYKYLLSYITLL